MAAGKNSVDRKLSGQRYKNAAKKTALICAVLVFVVVVVAPVAAIGIASLTGRPFSMESLDGPFSFSSWIMAYQDPAIYSSWLDTLRVAGVAALISTAIGTSLAWVVSKSVVPAAKLLRVALLIPLFLPTLLTALGFVVSASLVEKTLGLGFLNPYSYWGLVVALAVVAAPFVYLVALPAFDTLPADLEEAAALFGRSRLRAFLKVTVPITAQASLAALILTTLRLVDIVDLPLMLGYPAGINVFSVQIYTELYANVRPNYGTASALAASISILSLLVVVFFRRYSRSRDFTTVSGKGFRASTTVDIGRWKYLVAVYVWGFLGLSVVLPVGATLLGSFQGYFGAPTSGLTLDHWKEVLGDDAFLSLLRNTLIVGVACAVIIVSLGTAIALLERRRGGLSSIVGVVSWIPWIVPGIVLGIGLLWVTAATIGLSGWRSLLVIIITFSIIYIPLGARQVSAGLQQLGRELEEASEVSGVGKIRTFARVTFPLLFPSLAAAFLLSFALVTRDTNTALFIYTPQSETLGIRAVNDWRQGSASASAVYGVVIVLVNTCALVFYRLALRRADRFEVETTASAPEPAPKSEEKRKPLMV